MSANRRLRDMHAAWLRKITPADTEGERRKADALDLLEAHRDLYILRGRRALLSRLLETGVATADDVRDAVDLPPGINPKCFGVVPGALAKAGIIRAGGYVKTCRPAAHARPVTVWHLANPAAAERWLVGHPDQPDLDQSPSQGVLFPIHPTNDTGAAAATAAPVMEG